MEQEIINYSAEKLKRQKKAGYISIIFIALFMAVLNVVIANSQAAYEKTSFSQAFNIRLTIAEVIFVCLVAFITTIAICRNISARSVILEEDKFTYCSIKRAGILSSLTIGGLAGNILNSTMKVKKKDEILYSQIKKVTCKIKNGEIALITIKHNRGIVQLFNFDKLDRILQVIKTKVSCEVPIIEK